MPDLLSQSWGLVCVTSRRVKTFLRTLRQLYKSAGILVDYHLSLCLCLTCVHTPTDRALDTSPLMNCFSHWSRLCVRVCLSVCVLSNEEAGDVVLLLLSCPWAQVLSSFWVGVLQFSIHSSRRELQRIYSLLTWSEHDADILCVWHAWQRGTSVITYPQRHVCAVLLSILMIIDRHVIFNAILSFQLWHIQYVNLQMAKTRIRADSLLTKNIKSMCTITMQRFCCWALFLF